LNAEKFIKMTGVSKATATRDLGELVDRGLLRKQGEGKAVRYYVNLPGWSHGLR
jgi:Fic family protein